jgi:NADPH-dependent glutamate synthase beta subunit-like oxidoreductase
MVRVAIIGSGPAGLACAKHLADKKIQVVVFDELSKFGGMLAYGLPEFRLPLSQVNANIESAKILGVNFERKKIESVKKLLIKNGGEFDFVVLAIGAGKGSKLGLKGEENKKIIDALEFLKAYNLEKVCLVKQKEKVAVIGGGNSAIDTARLAKKCGAESKIIYRRTEKEMPAFGNELNEAKKEGIEFDFLKTPIEYNENKENGKIIVTFALMKLEGKDETGRAKPIDSGKRIEEEFDKVLLAIGQRNNLKWLENEGVKCEKGRVSIDENNLTSLENVYSCGDCVYGAKNIASATIDANKTAISILNLIDNN